MSSLKVDGWYGDTKMAKTSQVGWAAQYHAKKTGKPVRAIFSDAGGYASIQGDVDDGVVIPFVLSPERENLLETMDKLSRGWWPKDPKDPKSVLEYGKMDHISALIFDGATSWCRMLFTMFQGSVEYIVASDTIKATGVRSPDMPKDSFMRSGNYIRRFTGKADYGGVQQRAEEFIRNSAMLPVPAAWTMLETKGSDEGKKPIYGPDFLGVALTGVCGPWFGNLLHLDGVPVTKETKVGNRTFKTITNDIYLFTGHHIDPDDPTKVPYMAGTRVDRRLWHKVPPVMEARIDKFYEMVDKLAEEAKGMGSPIVQGVKA